MGIVNIEDELHEQLRRAAKASYRSINAQAAFWIRIGMLCETHPGVTFQELVARELRAAGVGFSRADGRRRVIKTPTEIELMAGAGRLLASVFTHLDGMTLEGLSTLEINDRVEAFIVDELKARPASKGQYGYGFVLNSSRNQVVCHGVPSADEVLKDGDIVNLDITLEKDGFIADSSKTYLIGSVGPQARRLVRITYEAMWKGIQAVRPGAKLGDIGFAIEKHARKAGYSVVRDYCGHGIGREMHEDPQVLHFGKAGTGATLREGMTFTIEPMLNQGVRTVLTEDDGWTVVTSDGKLSAQSEHTVAVTKDGVRVLTLRPEEKRVG